MCGFHNAATSRENQEEQAVRVCLETKVKRVMQEFQECRVLQVPKDPLALQGFQASVECFKKTEIIVKQILSNLEQISSIRTHVFLLSLGSPGLHGAKGEKGLPGLSGIPGLKGEPGREEI